MRQANTAETLRLLRNGVMPHIHVQQILSDHGTQFTSKQWGNKLRSWGIRPVLITIRHPQANPVERYMRTLGRFLRTYCHQQHNLWVCYLTNIENCINRTPHESTSFSPLHIIEGKRPRYALQDSIDKHIPRRQHLSITEIHAQVRQNLRKHANARIRRQDRKVIWTFSIGDMVLLRVNKPSDATTGTTKKFNLLYEGPFYVSAIPYPNVYELRRRMDGPVFGRFNTGNLIPYKTNE